MYPYAVRLCTDRAQPILQDWGLCGTHPPREVWAGCAQLAHTRFCRIAVYYDRSW